MMARNIFQLTVRGLVGLLLFAGWAAGSLQAPAPASPARLLRVADVQFEDDRGDVRYSLNTRAGSDIVLTFRVEGYERRRVEDPGGIPEERVWLRYEAELRDPQGALVQPAQQGEVDTILGPRDDQWRPRIRWSGSLPPYAPTGEYKVEIRVQDAQANTDAAASVPVRVQGELIQPADSLAVRQLEYASSAGGPWFSRRVFALGRPMHVRYKVAGFLASPENEVWVEQDWAVIDAGGNVIVSQENAVVEKRQSFYPPRFLSTSFELRLADAKPGMYTLRITVRDGVSGLSITDDSEFSLRP
ncbi:MAG: hypothetical protein ACRD88_04680 [Terriglobia bacterium]